MKNRKVKVVILVLILILLVLVLVVNFDSIIRVKRKSDMKIAVVFSESLSESLLHAHSESINALMESQKIDPSKIVIKDNLNEKNCFKTIEETVAEGCNLIFGVGKDIEDFIVQSATENSDIQYCFAEGQQASIMPLSNLHSFSLVESEAKYLAGIVSGVKIKDLLDNGEISIEEAVLGYVGTNENSENISSYTAFYLGAKSIVPDIKMKVKFINSECDIESEQKTARALIANGCCLLAQHSDSNSIAEICEQNAIYYICNKEQTKEKSNYSLVDTAEDWSSCYSYAVDCIINGEELPTSWSKGIDTSSVGISDINKNAFVFEKNINQANDTINESNEKIKAKTLHIFDIKNWKVNGETIASTLTDEFKGAYGGKEFIAEGRFMEYELTSMPKFAFKIDGIEILE